MSLTPKNWASFQHYKDRSPAWIKLHRGILDDFAFSRLPVASKALAPLLWLLASEHDGGTIPASFEEIAFRLRWSEADVVEAVKPLIAAKFFSADSDALAQCQQVACLEKEREERKEVEVEKEAESRSVAKATRPTASKKFQEFWEQYPRRQGPNPRAPAEKKFEALVRTGLSPDVLIQGARDASDAARKRGDYGSRFIPQTITWLNQSRWADAAAECFSAAAGAPRDAGKPLTEFQRGRNETKDILDDLGNFAAGGSSSTSDPGFLSGDPGERPERIRSGSGADIVALSAVGGRSRS